MSIVYFVAGQLAWFASVLSAARGTPSLGVGLIVLLLIAHLWRVPRPLVEFKFVAGVTLLGALWESLLVATGLLSYPSGMIAADIAPYWIVALWALFAAQFNTTYAWLKTRLGAAALLGMIAGPVSFRAGASLHALHFLKPWPAAAALAVGWACLLPLLAVLSLRWDGVKRAAPQGSAAA